MRTLVRYFFRGCLVLAPLAATLYVVYLVVTTVDHLIPVGIPGLGFVLTLGLITLVGFLASNVAGKAFFDLTERLLSHVPLVKLVYSSIKDLVGAFVGEKKRFDKPVMVSLIPGQTARALGFVTRETLPFIGGSGHVAVYFPQSYNFAGNVVIVPSGNVEALDVPAADLMTFIVSGGISGFGIGPKGESMPPPADAAGDA